MRIGAIIVLIFFIQGTLEAQPKSEELISKANTFYEQKAYKEAQDLYVEVLKYSPQHSIALFNLGNAYFRSAQTEKAIAQFDALAHSAGSPELRAKAFYNKGVLMGQLKNVEESITAYKNSLLLNPLDEKARENLQRALREKQSKQQKTLIVQKPKEKLNQQQVKQLLNALQQQENSLRQRLNKSQVPSPNKPEKDW